MTSRGAVRPSESGLREVERLLSELVACPSVNPGPDGANVPPCGERPLLRLLGERLAAWGAHVELRDVHPGRPNLVARFDGHPPQRCLLFEAHADTVPATGMTIAPFAPAVKDGRLYGRGACDAKGPMAAMLLAIRRVLEEEGRLPVTLLFVSTCDEEGGGSGAQALMAEGLRADAAVIGEPTGMTVIHSHKGVIRFRIATRGIPAHSSNPAAGVNAISKMRAVLDRIEGPMTASLSAASHPRLGSPTVAVGTIRGGTQANVLPGLCEIEVDRRLIPGETADGIAAEFERMLADLRAADPRFDAGLEQTEFYPPLEEDPQAGIVQALAAACRSVQGHAELGGVPWASNAGFFRRAGIPCAVFGPGSVKQAHTRDEWIDLAEVTRAVGIYAELIRTWGREP